MPDWGTGLARWDHPEFRKYAAAAEKDGRSTFLHGLGTSNLTEELHDRAAAIVERAKALGGLKTSSGSWVFPDRASTQEIRDAIQAWRHDANQLLIQRLRREVEEGDRKAAAAREREQEQYRAVLARSDRTPTGEFVRRSLYDTQTLDRVAAQAMAYQLGQVIDLDRSREGVVVEVEIRFYTQDEAEAQMDDAGPFTHWRWNYTVAVVDPA